MFISGEVQSDYRVARCVQFFSQVLLFWHINHCQLDLWPLELCCSSLESCRHALAFSRQRCNWQTRRGNEDLISYTPCSRLFVRLPYESMKVKGHAVLGLMFNLQKCTRSWSCFLSALLKFPFFSCNTPSFSGNCLSSFVSAATHTPRQKAVTHSSKSLFMAVQSHTDKLGGSGEREVWCVYQCRGGITVNPCVICRLDPAAYSWLTFLSEHCCMSAIGCCSYQALVSKR